MNYKGGVFQVATAASTAAYGGTLRIPVHPETGSVSAMGISYELGPGEESREIRLAMSECGLCVLQGDGMVRIGEKEQDFGVGHLAFVPARTTFVIRNTGDTLLLIAGLISPPDPDMLRLAGLWGRTEDEHGH